MKILARIARLLAFDDKKSEFELLETEEGSPPFFASQTHDRPTAKKKTPPPCNITASLKESMEQLKRDFRADINSDLTVRGFMMGGAKGKTVPAMLAFINGMVDKDTINDFILRESMRDGCLDAATAPLCEFVIKRIFTMNEMQMETDWNLIKAAMLDGSTAIFIEGEDAAILADTRGYEHRSIGTAQNEKVVRGPQEGFNENMRTNITLLRRLIRREDLVCEQRDAGGENNLKLCIVYLEGTANITLVEEVKRRLGGVNTRVLLNAGMLEQLTESRRRAPFPQVLSTERPDRTAAFLMQGYVAVLIEGNPFASIMPTTLWSLMSSSEDAYLRQPEGNVVRVIRYIGALLSILLPGYFLALTLFHPGLLSTEVVSTIISSREMVFLPIAVEMIFLMAVFQLIREAGLRVPGNFGQAIGIIGGLILGQAAVAANLASSVILIVVAFAGLGNFCIPDFSMQISASYLRLGIVLAAWLAGLLGVICFVVLILGYMVQLKSYGVPFLAPVAPKVFSKQPPIFRGAVTMQGRAPDIANTQERGA
ncbi:MAG: spore germination protein [Christensenellaceae bacterium]|jgi:spore germination protein KA|nr:spore germination protein [Christensenellaceae bacterium]